MRVTPPDLLKIDRHELLRDVRERLAERAPQLAAGLDKAHPAWLILEEAAWMVESLSEQLDQWPWAVLQQFAHLLGAELQPACPAVGVVVVTSGQDGELSLGENPSRWRFLTPQTEERGIVEFVPAESSVPVVAGQIASVCRLIEGELVRCLPPPPGTELSEAWRTVMEGERSSIFDGETLRFVLVGTDAERLEADLREAIQRMAAERPVGWLQLDVVRVDAQTVELVARIEPALAFGPDTGEPGDAFATWATLDDSVWTPPVRVANHPLLPLRLRLTRPLPTEGGLMVPDVPANVLRRDLLVREARPAPADLPMALWRTLTHLVAALAPLRPRVIRSLPSVPGEPTWVEEALRTGAWFKLASSNDATLVHLAVPTEEHPLPVRFGVTVAGEGAAAPPSVRLFVLDRQHGLLPDELSYVCPWSMALPRATVYAFEAQVPPGAQGLLVAVAGKPAAVLLNPMLVINAPVVRDGRRVGVERAVPEPVSLLHRDIVTREVIDRLVASGLDPSAARVVAEMPLGLARVEDRVIASFQGVAVDAPQGTLTLNAPDERGVVHEIRRGEEVEIEWYRRTQASLGNVAAGEIRLVEQASNARPRLTGVLNPLPTAWGADRERDEEAVARVFGPQIGVPVTPGDWERLVRSALGRRGADWTVRVWGYAERTLVSTELWPCRTGPAVDPAREQLAQQLASAGPEVLLVTVGPLRGILGPEDTEYARRTIEALISRWHERVPTIQRAIVAPLVPVTLVGSGAGPFPKFSLSGMSGELFDALGRRAPVPRVSLLLNAAIVEVVQ